MPATHDHPARPADRPPPVPEGRPSRRPLLGAGVASAPLFIGLPPVQAAMREDAAQGRA